MVRVPRHRRRASAVRTQYLVGRDGALVKANVSCSDSDSYSSSPRACDGESSDAATDLSQMLCSCACEQMDVVEIDSNSVCVSVSNNVGHTELQGTMFSRF